MKVDIETIKMIEGLINLKEFSIRSKSFEAQEYNNEIKSSYNLGYIFGTFLGDGHSRVNIHKNSVRGKVSWYFNKTETDIVYKLTTDLNPEFFVPITFTDWPFLLMTKSPTFTSSIFL